MQEENIKKGAKEPSGIAFKDDIPHKKNGNRTAQWSVRNSKVAITNWRLTEMNADASNKRANIQVKSIWKLHDYHSKEDNKKRD